MRVWAACATLTMACFPSVDGFGPPDAMGSDAATDPDTRVQDAQPDADGAAPPLVTLAQSAPFGYELAPSMSQQLHSAVAAGDLLVAVMASHNPSSGPTFAISDTLGNTWLSSPSYLCSYGNAGVRLFYVESSRPGIDTVTVTQNPTPPADAGTNYELGLALFEYSGVAQTSALDVESGVCAATATTSMASPTISTTAPDMLVGVFVDPCGQGTMTPGIGWTAEDVYQPYFYMMEDQLGPGHSGVPVGTHQATGTNPNVSQCWVSMVAAFKLR